eukprot:PhM_4_TR18774/c0_g1_i1/m.58836/K00464/diox1; all-trans-8'-apo-beta-carotenal 15,15'-oxygenase
MMSAKASCEAWGTHCSSAVAEHSLWLQDTCIEGTLPPELRGTFFRNGPGQMNVFGTALAHPLDGDGMICAVTFIDGRVHFRNRFVVTETRRQEQKAGKILYPGHFGTMREMVVKPPSLTAFRNSANTGIWEWGGVLVATYERSLPVLLDPRTLETVSSASFLGGALDCAKALSAHPRFDVKRHRLVTLSLKRGKCTCPAHYHHQTFDNVVHFTEFDVRWKVVHQQRLQIERIHHTHDFLLLDDMYIIPASVEFSPGESAATTPTRLYLVPRFEDTTKRPVRYVDLFPCHIYHLGFGTVESQHHITVNAVCYAPNFTFTFANKSTLTNVEEAPGQLYTFRVNMEKFTCKETNHNEGDDKTAFESITAAQVPTARYVYLLACPDTTQSPPSFREIVKMDMLSSSSSSSNKKAQQRWTAPEGGALGEPCFVSRLGAAAEASGRGDEDDGWILTQEYDAVSHTTNIVVLDAKHIEAGPVCRVRTGLFVPMCVHTAWCPEVFTRPKIAKL